MNAMTEPLLFKQGDRELVSFATHPAQVPALDAWPWKATSRA